MFMAISETKTNNIFSIWKIPFKELVLKRYQQDECTLVSIMKEKKVCFIKPNFLIKIIIKIMWMW